MVRHRHYFFFLHPSHPHINLIFFLNAMDFTTRRLMPLLCFQCGMPLNNKQQTYDVAVREGIDTEGFSKEALFTQLRLDRNCCRVTMAFSADDTRLHRVAKPSSTFVPIHRASNLESAVYTVRADGTSDPI